jgi:GNAT superfamily N-acetyltransferase
MYQQCLAVTVRPGTAPEDEYVSSCFANFWREIWDREDCVVTDCDERNRTFMSHARENARLSSFVAEHNTCTGNSTLVGCACCQLFQGLYPLIVSPELRQYGYIWGVFVEPEYRGSGLGKQLVEACIEYLRSLGCTRVTLHAAPLAEPLYKRLGFVPNNEMKLDLLPSHSAGGATQNAPSSSNDANVA